MFFYIKHHQNLFVGPLFYLMWSIAVVLSLETSGHSVSLHIISHNHKYQISSGFKPQPWKHSLLDCLRVMLYSLPNLLFGLTSWNWPFQSLTGLCTMENDLDFCPILALPVFWLLDKALGFIDSMGYYHLDYLPEGFIPLIFPSQGLPSVWVSITLQTFKFSALD